MEIFTYLMLQVVKLKINNALLKFHYLINFTILYFILIINLLKIYTFQSLTVIVLKTHIICLSY